MDQVNNRVLVLRLPGKDQNYVFRIAEMPRANASALEERIRTQRWNQIESELDHTFGRPMDLSQAVLALPHENYTVLQPTL